MKTHIKTTNIELSEAISAYVAKRFEKIESLTSQDPAAQCDIELGRTTAHHHKGEIFRAEAHIVGSGMNIYTSSEKEDLYAAIDDVRDGVLRELKATHQKSESAMRRGGAKVKAMMKGMWPWGNRESSL